ncbi:MAG: DUF1778 domain-containing protein [Gammaproteobacteria bacterium]|nr:DUF1778 domain-containing protein [Gammaproteobacteria bacterium]
MSKVERIDFRIEPEIKEQFSDAAKTFGMNLTTFMVAAAKELAVRAQRIEQIPSLSNRDRDLFLAALDRPVRPIPESIRKAKERHASVVVSS